MIKGTGREPVTFFLFIIVLFMERGFGVRTVLTCSQPCRPQSTDVLFRCNDKSSVGCCFLEMLSSGDCWSLAPARRCCLDGFSLLVRGSSGAWGGWGGGEEFGLLLEKLRWSPPQSRTFKESQMFLSSSHLKFHFGYLNNIWPSLWGFIYYW